MTKKLVWLSGVAGLMTMGVAMPSCPGQQAMQQQIDDVMKVSTDMTRKLQSQDAKIKGLESDMGQVKQLLGQMTNAIQAQKGALEQLDVSVKDLAAKAAAKPAAKSATKGKKRK